MKLSINISTEKEITYPQDGTGSAKVLNAGDVDRQAQSINYNIIGFNYDGSLQPLYDLIVEWIKKQK